MDIKWLQHWETDVVIPVLIPVDHDIAVEDLELGLVIVLGGNGDTHAGHDPSRIFEFDLQLALGLVGISTIYYAIFRTPPHHELGLKLMFWDPWKVLKELKRWGRELHEKVRVFLHKVRRALAGSKQRQDILSLSEYRLQLFLSYGLLRDVDIREIWLRRCCLEGWLCLLWLRDHPHKMTMDYGFCALFRTKLFSLLRFYAVRKPLKVRNGLRDC